MKYGKWNRNSCRSVHSIARRNSYPITDKPAMNYSTSIDFCSPIKSVLADMHIHEPELPASHNEEMSVCRVGRLIDVDDGRVAVTGTCGKRGEESGDELLENERLSDLESPELQHCNRFPRGPSSSMCSSGIRDSLTIHQMVEIFEQANTVAARIALAASQLEPGNTSGDSEGTGMRSLSPSPLSAGWAYATTSTPVKDYQQGNDHTQPAIQTRLQFSSSFSSLHPSSANKNLSAITSSNNNTAISQDSISTTGISAKAAATTGSKISRQNSNAISKSNSIDSKSDSVKPGVTRRASVSGRIGQDLKPGPRGLTGGVKSTGPQQDKGGVKGSSRSTSGVKRNAENIAPSAENKVTEDPAPTLTNKPSIVLRRTSNITSKPPRPPSTNLSTGNSAVASNTSAINAKRSRLSVGSTAGSASVVMRRRTLSSTAQQQRITTPAGNSSSSTASSAESGKRKSISVLPSGDISTSSQSTRRSIGGLPSASTQNERSTSAVLSGTVKDKSTRNSISGVPSRAETGSKIETGSRLECGSRAEAVTSDKRKSLTKPVCTVVATQALMADKKLGSKESSTVSAASSSQSAGAARRLSGVAQGGRIGPRAVRPAARLPPSGAQRGSAMRNIEN